MAGSEAAQKPSAGSYSVSPFVKKEVHDQIANRSAKARVSWNWYDTWHEEHHRAFVVAKLCKADLLQEVHDSLQKAVDEGQTFEEWRKEIQPKLEGRWLGKTEGELWDEMEEEDKKRLKEQAKEEGRPDPEPTGKQRDKEITPKRLETIYRTNMKVAHVAGQYQSLIDKAELYPYWQYHTQEDDRVRGSHAVLNNKVFRYDDPFWDTHFPPNGWRCRCYVLSLNERGLKRQGLSTDDVIDSSKLKTREDESAGGHTKLTYIIDGKDASTADGWNYNPGKIRNIDSVAKDKIDGYDPELGKQVEGDIKEKAQPKPTAPKQPSAVPSQDKKRPEPAKKPTPKPAAPKPAVSTEKPKAEDKPKAQPAVSQPKPSDKPAVKPVAAPKPKPATAEPRPAVAPTPAAVPKPAPASAVSKPVQQTPAPTKPAVKSTTAAQPQQRDQQTAVIKDVIAPGKNQITEPIKPLEPSAPRVIKSIEPADPSIPRAIKPSKSGDPSIPRVAETVKPAEPPKPEAKQSILQTIRNKVGRAVDRVLGWLGVSSKWSPFGKLANGDKQGVYYADNPIKKSMPPATNNTTAAQSKQQKLKEASKWADSKQMMQPIAKMAGLKDKPMGHSKTKAQAKQQNKAMSAYSFEHFNHLAEELQSSNPPQQPAFNKETVRQELEWEIDKLKANGNYPPVQHGEPFPHYREEAKFITDVAFPNPGYNNIEHAQAVIHNKTLEHAIIFSKNKKCLVEVVGDARNVALSVRYKGEPYIVIHNHPHGSIFSPTDIGWAMQSGVHELRVVCKGDGVYSFSPSEYAKAMPGKNAEIHFWSIIGNAIAEFDDVPDGTRSLDEYIKEYAAKKFPGIRQIA